MGCRDRLIGHAGHAYPGGWNVAISSEHHGVQAPRSLEYRFEMRKSARHNDGRHRAFVVSGTDHPLLFMEFMAGLGPAREEQ